MIGRWNEIHHSFLKLLEEEKNWWACVGSITHNPQASSVRYLVCKNLVPVFKIGCTLIRFLLDSPIKSSRQPPIARDGLLSTSPKIACTPMIRSISTTSVTVVNNRLVSHFPWSSGHSGVLPGETRSSGIACWIYTFRGVSIGFRITSTDKYLSRTFVGHVVFVEAATASCLGKVDNLGSLDHSNHALRSRTWNQIIVFHERVRNNNECCIGVYSSSLDWLAALYSLRIWYCTSHIAVER